MSSVSKLREVTLGIEWSQTDTRTFLHMVIALFFPYPSAITINSKLTFLVQLALYCLIVRRKDAHGGIRKTPRKKKYLLSEHRFKERYTSYVKIRNKTSRTSHVF